MCYHITTTRACEHRTTAIYECRGHVNTGECSIESEDISIQHNFTCIECLHNRDYWAALTHTPYTLPNYLHDAQRISDTFHGYQLPLFCEIWDVPPTNSEYLTLLPPADNAWLANARASVDLAARSLLNQRFSIFVADETISNCRARYFQFIETLHFLNSIFERSMYALAVWNAISSRITALRASCKRLKEEVLMPLVREVSLESVLADFEGCPICGVREDLVHLACPAEHIFCRRCMEEWVKDKDVATCPLDRCAFSRIEFDFPEQAGDEGDNNDDDDDNDEEMQFPTPHWLTALRD